MFGHERFEAYQLAIGFFALALQLIEQTPAGNSVLKDQLRRAGSSIALNIAEGTGKMEKGDQRRFYSIARGSAMECAAICDVITLLDGKLEKRTREAKKLLLSIVNILTKICIE